MSPLPPARPIRPSTSSGPAAVTPTITPFTVTPAVLPNAGTVTLAWATQDATSVSIAGSTNTLMTLPNGAHVFAVRTASTQTLAWTAVPKAGPGLDLAYEVLLTDAAAGGRPELQIVVPDADVYRVYVVQPTGGPGVVVAACNGDGSGPWSRDVLINPPGPNPSSPNLGTPLAASVVNGPGVEFSWNRIPGDDGTNTWYRLYVQDLSGQSAALDVYPTQSFYAAYFKAEGARYDALVLAHPGLPGEVAGPPIGFRVRGTSATAPTMVSPSHLSRVPAGNLQLGWSPVPGATLYQYYVAALGQGSATVTGVTPGLVVQVPLPAVGGAETTYSGITRACMSPTGCAPTAWKRANASGRETVILMNKS